MYTKLVKVDPENVTFEEFCDEYFGMEKKKNLVDFRNVLKKYLYIVKTSKHERILKHSNFSFPERKIDIWRNSLQLKKIEKFCFQRKKRRRRRTQTHLRGVRWREQGKILVHTWVQAPINPLKHEEKKSEKKNKKYGKKD